MILWLPEGEQCEKPHVSTWGINASIQPSTPLRLRERLRLTNAPIPIVYYIETTYMASLAVGMGKSHRMPANGMTDLRLMVLTAEDHRI